MMQQFEQMSSRLNYKPQELGDIKERLKEDDIRGGAFYCSLPSFRDSYRLVSRIIERNGQSVYLMLCSITNGKGMPMDKPDKLEVLSGELQNTIQQCLRKGDSFTKYSPSQFLILLVGTNKENCSMIFDRIQRYFSREHKSWKQYLDYFVSSVAEVDRQDSPIQLSSQQGRNGDNLWNRAIKSVGMHQTLLTCVLIILMMESCPVGFITATAKNPGNSPISFS